MDAVIQWASRDSTAVTIAFVAVHVWLGLAALVVVHHSMGDVTHEYRYWALSGLRSAHWMGVGRPFVYPIVSLLPMLVAALGGHAGFDVVWVVEVIALDAIAVSMLARSRRGRVAALFWLATLAALGPVSIGRLDAVAAALGIMAISILSTRPRVAGALLALGTWIKFAPAAFVVAAVTAGWARRRVLIGALGFSVLVVGVAVVMLHSTQLFSFVLMQDSRGLQIEAPAATPLLWEAWMHVRGAELVWSPHMNTWQVTGPHGHLLEAGAQLGLPAACVAAVLLGLRAARRGSDRRVVTALLAMALTIAFCAFDKVGSPQYQAWFAVPIALGVLVMPRRMRIPAALVLISCGLTQVIYPWHYEALVGLHLWMLLLISTRNLVELVIYGWAVLALWRSGTVAHAVEAHRAVAAEG